MAIVKGDMLDSMHSVFSSYVFLTTTSYTWSLQIVSVFIHKTEFINNKVSERLDLKVRGQRQVFNESPLFSENITFKLHQWI